MPRTSEMDVRREEAAGAATRVLLADPHRLLRQALRRLLEAQAGVRVVGEASDSEELEARLRADGADIALVAIELPGVSGLEVIRRARAAGRSTRFIVVSSHEGFVHLRRAFEAGALGYVPKTADAGELIEAIAAVREGHAYLSPCLTSVARALAGRPLAAARDRIGALTAREREVLALVGEGLSAREMAERLGVSPRTIEAHRSRLMTKLSVHRSSMLVRIALEEGLVQR